MEKEPLMNAAPENEEEKTPGLKVNPRTGEILTEEEEKERKRANEDSEDWREQK